MASISALKMLSLTQPWAQLVVEGHKEFETRSWTTPYRGWLGIHASKGFPRDCQGLLEEEPFLSALNRPPEEMPRGAVVGMVFLRDVMPTETTLKVHVISNQEEEFGDWYPGRFAWWLGSPRLLPKPIPWRGALGLWAPPEDLEQAIWSNVESYA